MTGEHFLGAENAREARETLVPRFINAAEWSVPSDIELKAGHNSMMGHAI